MQLLLLCVGSFGCNVQSADPTKRVIVTTRSHETDDVRRAVAACQPTDTQHVGGAGHKVGVTHSMLVALVTR